MIERYKQEEIARLKFYFDRDKLEGALAFAAQTFGLYRAARREKKRGYGNAYRIPLVCSMVVFRQFLRKTK